MEEKERRARMTCYSQSIHKHTLDEVVADSSLLKKIYVHSLHNRFGLAHAKDADDPVEDFQPMSRLLLLLHKLMRGEILKPGFEGIACILGQTEIAVFSRPF